MKILCVGYREWALNIYKNISTCKDHEFLLISSKNQYNEAIITQFSPDLILFYGWSWHVSENIVNRFKCLMLHPSALPKYRGGSPLQNQIINGVKNSKVTIFVMNLDMDAGNILCQEYLSLEGDISDIFKRMEKIGTKLTKSILQNMPKEKKQNHNESTYCKRRNIHESQITLEELKNKNSNYLFNKIRMLTDPYPNAYIKTKDGKFILLKKVELVDEYPFS